MIEKYISERESYVIGVSGNLDKIEIVFHDPEDFVMLNFDLGQAQELRDILDRAILSLKALKNTPNKPLDKNFPNSPSDKPIREEIV